MKFPAAIVLLAAGVAIANAQTSGAAQQAPAPGHTPTLLIKALTPKTETRLTVTSPAFKDGANIPWENTEYRGNIFPGLTWTKGPQGTRSYAVIMQGLLQNSPAGPTSIHMTLFNIPVPVTTLKAGMTAPPAGATFGENIHGINQSYAGPHTHTSNPSGYHFQVFALDTALDLPPSASFDAMADALKGHVLASGELMGVSVRDPESKDEPLSAAPTRIETGLIAGLPGRDKSIMVYKGIPFAAPPVGKLCFAAPQPPLPWDGVYKAEHYGKMCPQSGNQDNMSEDCLFANVWTGASFATERRPVFVWIFGGGFNVGSGSSAEFDGEALARKGIVVVTFNYRLGALGFLATPELSKESGHNASGNFGLLDQIALLQWVHNNIAAFGGDPNRVTVGGQSAGAGSTGFLAMSPLAKGLFLRGIQQSHARYSRDPELRFLAVSHRTLKDAEAEGEKWQEAHGAHLIAELRAKPWQNLIATMSEVETSVDTLTDAEPPLFRPVVDGWVIPKNYADTYASHSQNNVAIIAGEDRDESGAVPENTFALRCAQPGRLAFGLHINVTLADFDAAAKRRFGPLTAEFLKLYPASNDDEAAMMNNQSARDNGLVSTYLWARDWKPGTGEPVYLYYWTHRPTGDPNGAHHGSEILFVFDNLDLKPNKEPWTDEDRKVADTISSYWVNYIATGDPNGPGLPRWPQFDPTSRTIMEIGDRYGPIPPANPERMAFWEKFYQMQQAW